MAELIEICKALELVKDFNPLQRILLTCSGTLQGTLSAFFNREVTVRLVEQSAQTEERWPLVRRVAKLEAGNVTVCAADSLIKVADDDIHHKLLQGRVGIGQILESAGIRPSFRLLEVGQTDENFWRLYTLEASHVSYRIREAFPRRLYPWPLPPHGT